MANRIRTALVTVSLAALVPGSAFAVNCEQVRRYLAAGRSADDIAETMIISVDDVKKCQEAAAAQPAGAEKPAQQPEKKDKE